MRTSKNHNLWLYCVCFFLGSLVTYVTLQFRFFEIKKELDIPNLLISTITLVIGIYIADTLQKRVNRNQNQHEYLVNKLDLIWIDFNDFSEKLLYSDQIDSGSIGSLNKDIIHSVSFLKSVFNSFEIDDTCVCELETEVDGLEELLADLPAKDNIADCSGSRQDIDERIVQVNQSFSSILKVIQNV